MKSEPITGLIPVGEQFRGEYGPARTQQYALLNSGQLHAVKVGRRTYIAREEAERWRRSLPAYLISGKSITPAMIVGKAANGKSVANVALAARADEVRTVLVTKSKNGARS